MSALSIGTMGLLLGCAHENHRNATAAAPSTHERRGEFVGATHQGAQRATDQGAPEKGATNMQADGTDAAIVERLSRARCDREQSCGNIGGGQKYVSRDVCMDQMRGTIANDLNTFNCPGGLDRGEVEHCLSAIKSEQCGHPFETIGRMQRCRTGALCVK
jgi:hypothetical protein